MIIASGLRRGVAASIPDAPPAPLNFSASVTNDDILLTWSDDSGGTAQHLIERSLDEVSWAPIATKAAGVTSHTDSNLAQDQYFYRIYAFKNGQNSAYDYASAIIVSPVPDAPSSLSAVASSSTINLTWTDNSGGAATFRIERSTTSNSAGFSTLTTKSAGVTSHSDASLADGTYWYRVIAVVGGVDSAPSNVSSAAVSTGAAGISSTSGITADGASFTVNGAGFGAMDGDVLGYIRGDEHANDTIINGTAPTVGGSVSTNIVGVGSDATGDYLRYSSSAARGNKARGVRRVHTGSVTGVYRPGGFGFTGLNATKYYATYCRRANVTWNTTNTYNYKHFYTFGNSSTNPQTMLFVPSRGNSFGFYNNNPLSSDSYSVQNMSNSAGWNGSNEANTWHRWEIFADYANTPTIRNGVLRVWRNRTLGINSDTWIGRGPGLGDTTYTTQWFLGYMDLNLDGSWDHTDIYFADTPARVELGNASTWSACTQTEIQVARNSNWSNTAITGVQLNYGAFLSGQTVYLYVIKSDGQPVSNNGFAVVLP